MEDEVKIRTLKSFSFLVLIAAVMVLGACGKKKVQAPPPPPPPPPAAPTASLSASPDTINAGQSSTLTWQTTNATDVSIDGLGAVQPTGQKTVTPSQSTTYRLTAKGPGGTQEATARVTVTPPPPTQTAPQPTQSEEEMFNANVKDIYFDYDKYDVRSDAQQTLQQDAQWLSQHPNVTFTIEGHCDERGSTEYNLALGDNRAQSAKNALVQMGVPANRIKTISYGKEKPFCTESNEQCWQENRRDHFVYQK